MPQFTKKPVTIEAMRWDGTAKSAIDVINWAVSHDDGACIRFHEAQPETTLKGKVVREAVPPLLIIDTLEGVMHATAGDYIIRGVNGEFYPCKPDIFAKSYDEVDPKKVLQVLETKRALLQTVVEASRGNQILDQQLKHAQFHSARGTLATMRQITKLQDELIPKLIRG